MPDTTIVTIATQGLPGAQGERGEIGIGKAGATGRQGAQGVPGPQGAHGVVDGGGSKGSIPVYADTTILADSQIHQYLVNSSVFIGIGTKLPVAPLHVAYTGNPTDVILSLSSASVNSPHIDISTDFIQSYDSTSGTGELQINPMGGKTTIGSDLQFGLGDYELVTQKGKAFTSATNGLIITTPTGTATNLLIVAPDKTPLIENLATTTNITLVPVTGNVSVGPNSTPNNQLATLDVAGTMRVSTSASSGKFITNNGNILAAGDATITDYIVRNSTVNGTQTELFTDGTSARITLPNNQSSLYRVDIVGRQLDGSNSLMMTLTGGVDVNSSGVATMRDANEVTLNLSDNTWDFAVNVLTVGSTNYLQLNAIGAASTTTHWVAAVRVTSVG